MPSDRESFFQQELDMLNRNLAAGIRFRFGVGISLFALSFLLCATAFLTRHAGFFGAAGLLMLLLMSADFVMIRAVFGYYYRANRILVEKFGITEDNVFDMSLIFIRFNKMKKIHRVMNIENEAERYRALRRLPVTIPTFLGFFAPLTALIAEIWLVCWALSQPGWGW